MAAVYVLHFDPPLKHAKHYVGFTEADDVATRLDEHLKGAGSRLVRAAVANGCAIHLAHVFVGADRHFERRVKKSTDVCRWCRMCGRNERPKPRVRQPEGGITK